jgi:transcriptional regulator with XRE-family HTH domain
LDWWGRIRQARERMQPKMRQQDAADRMAVAQQTYSGWETGKSEPTLADFVKLAGLYGTVPEWLAFGVEMDPRNLIDRETIRAAILAVEKAPLALSPEDKLQLIFNLYEMARTLRVNDLPAVLESLLAASKRTR